MSLPPFEMERWQSLHEHRVDVNLSESGVHPLTLEELAELTGVAPGDTLLAYTQTNGTEALRQRIAALYPGASPGHVLVTTGGAEANYLAVRELLSAGQEAAILVPTYGQTPGLARGIGATVRPLALEEAHGWQPAPGAAGEAIGAETRLVVVTNPNNPTGAVLSERARAEVAAAAEGAGAWILSDEVYAGAEVVGDGLGLDDAPETESLWGEAERVVITGSLSKAYGLPGLRLGWLVAPPPLIEALWGRKDYTTIAPTALSDRLATAALEPGARRRILRRTRRMVRDNLAQLRAWVRERGDLLSWRPPDAGSIAWLRYDLPVRSDRLADGLRREEGVLLVPGTQFGMDGHVRIGFGLEADALREGLTRTGRYLATLAA